MRLQIISNDKREGWLTDALILADLLRDQSYELGCNIGLEVGVYILTPEGQSEISQRNQTHGLLKDRIRRLAAPQERVPVSDGMFGNFLDAMAGEGWIAEYGENDTVIMLTQKDNEKIRIPGQAQVNSWFGQWLRTGQTPSPF